MVIVLVLLCAWVTSGAIAVNAKVTATATNTAKRTTPLIGFTGGKSARCACEDDDHSFSTEASSQ